MFEFFKNKPKKVTRIAPPCGAVPLSLATLMDQRGWCKTKTGAAGPFATRYGTWHGSYEKAGDTIRIYILDPPAVLQKHPKWPCFHRHGDTGWWRIHLHTNPIDGDANSVIRYVEQIISESYKL